MIYNYINNCIIVYLVYIIYFRVRLLLFTLFTGLKNPRNYLIFNNLYDKQICKHKILLCFLCLFCYIANKNDIIMAQDWNALRSRYKEAKEEDWAELKGLKPKATKKKTGRKKAIPTPARMWELFCDYGEWVDTNPIIKYDVVKSGDNIGTILQVPVQRPYTWSGFSAYVFRRGIVDSLDFYRTNWRGNYEAFQGVMKVIGDYMYAQKFEYAAVGVFREGIIARDLQIREQQDINVNNTGEQQQAPVINVYNGHAPGFANSEDEVKLEKDDNYTTRK